MHESVDNLIHKGTCYTVDTILDLPPTIIPASLSTQTTDNLVRFYGKDNPFCNFDNSPVTIKRTRYCCNGQFYLKSKRDFFTVEDTCMKIMATSNQARQFFLGQKVIYFDETRWKQESDDAMLFELREKFKIPKYKNLLLQNGRKKIAGCYGHSPCRGIELFVDNPHSNDPNRWAGENTNCSVARSS